MESLAPLISSDHPNARTYTRASTAFRERDLATVAETLHESISWHMPGTTWVAREIRSRDGLLAYLRELMERTRGTFELRDELVSGTDDHVLAIQSFGASVGGKTERFRCSSVMRFEGGKQVERWFHFHDLEAFDAFFAAF